MQLNLPRGSVYLVAAVAAGLVATFAIHRYISVKTHVPVVATRNVVIATADISPGTALGGKLIKTVAWPNGVIPPKSAATLGEVEGRVVKVPISQGNPVLFSMLAPQGTAAGLSGILEDGKRALTVKVDEVAGVAGFIHPGDHVDVLVDLPVREATDHFSKTILHDITVLSTGQIWEQKGDSKPVVVNTVTLELTPEDSEVLNLASNEGKIRLALRNRNNRTIAETKGVTTSVLTNGIAKKETKAPALKPVAEKSVEVIKGLDRSEAKL
ncbi:MAG: Flp pilus assembly protein CpaB [Syntrophobacterales bacterium]|jgi:pilus assembly protein CpaB|nr:Flp pilus assembly protein CpaB [Syntrophobacterales bacterium]